MSSANPKATAMPGGAPLKRSSKRPCKYGQRDADGRCPKKPRAGSSSSRTSSGGSSKPPRAAKAKPCKYGPRTAEGKCPKKPKSARAPSVRDYESVSSAARQAGQVLRSKKATTEQKHEAVKVLGAAVATESGKKVVEHVVHEARKALRTPTGRAAAASVARKAAGAVKAVGTATAIGTVLTIGGAALDANRDREAKKYADRQLAATKKRLKQKLTSEQESTLRSQYAEYYKKLPPSNSFTGK